LYPPSLAFSYVHRSSFTFTAKKPPMQALVIIPTYNEIDNVAAIASAVLKVHESLHVLVVDDNSPDGTSDAVRAMMHSEPRLHLLQRAGKMGLGTAYCEGFRYALDQGYEFVFEMDADFSHDPNDIPRFLEAIQTTDLVIGSRYVSGVNVVNWPMQRLLLSWCANLYTRAITRMPIADATGGFKCFRAEILRGIDLTKIHSNGYAFQIEMNFKVWRKKARIIEIPIIFIDRRSGTSKMSKNIIWEAAGLVWKLKLSSLLGRL
jgi:dolichol-phosphate mannosyltransferase